MAPQLPPLSASSSQFAADGAALSGGSGFVAASNAPLAYELSAYAPLDSGLYEEPRPQPAPAPGARPWWWPSELSSKELEQRPVWDARFSLEHGRQYWVHRGTGQVSWDPPPRPRSGGERQRAELPISRKHKPKRGRSSLLRGMLAGGWAAPLAMPPKAAPATTPFTMLTASLPRAPSPYSLLAAKNQDIARSRGDSGAQPPTDLSGYLREHGLEAFETELRELGVSTPAGMAQLTEGEMALVVDVAKPLIVQRLREAAAHGRHATDAVAAASRGGGDTAGGAAVQAPREARQPGRRTVPEPEPEPEPVSAPPPKPAAQAAPKPAAPPQPKPEKRKVSFKGAVKKQITAKTWAQDMIGEGFRQAVYDDLSEEDRAAADKLKAEQSREELTGSLRMAASAGKVRLPQPRSKWRASSCAC